MIDSKNNWVPCSERLPNEEERKESALDYNNPELYASEFIVMISGALRPTSLLLTHDDIWIDEMWEQEYDVVAWRMLPEPYKDK